MASLTLILVFFPTVTRWQIVIHGGVDGYSRCITYLNCHNNNQAVTALGEFVVAVEKYGLPSRVRSDQGVENVDITRFMLNHPDRGRIVEVT